MPLSRVNIETARRAHEERIAAVTMPSDNELSDLKLLAKTDWVRFEKALAAGKIVDFTDLIGASNTFAAKDAIKSHGGYFGSLLSHWFVAASQVEPLMKAIGK